MSREIKFRAYDTHFRCYEQLDLLFSIRKGSPKRWLLEQYTGIKDKNGKEIYEGDIVRITRELTKTRTAVYIYQIKYDCSRAAFTCWKNGHFACMFFESSGGQCEVIGNIHENPELLKNDG